MFQKLNYMNDVDYSPNRICKELGYCPVHEKWEVDYQKINKTYLDIKVTKALGSKGYNKVRLSVVTNKTDPILDKMNFTYKRQF